MFKDNFEKTRKKDRVIFRRWLRMTRARRDTLRYWRRRRHTRVFTIYDKGVRQTYENKPTVTAIRAKRRATTLHATSIPNSSGRWFVFTEAIRDWPTDQSAYAKFKPSIKDPKNTLESSITGNFAPICNGYDDAWETRDSQVWSHATVQGS